jgi:glycosidase
VTIKEFYMYSTFHSDIVYQIFPERFNIGKNRNVEEKVNQGMYEHNAIVKQWYEKPEDSGTRQFEMYGGDLEGIIEKLDYLEKLGITTIYLNPIFQSETNHKYDSIDYYMVDKAFGGDEAFEELLTAVHARGMKLIIDLVLNHISHLHPIFQEALKNPESHYRDYFYFTDYPEEYNCWWGIKTMPELNLHNQDVIDTFITGEKSVIHFWAKKGIDGIRLDCANDLGVEVLKTIKQSVKSINHEIIVIGEVFNFAPEFSPVLDSLQTYFFTSSIFSVLNGSISTTQFGKNLERAIAEYPHDRLVRNLLILSSHDAPRILNQLRGDYNKLKLALTLQFTLPGVPKIYYGDEIGMAGGMDPENRAPMVWDESQWNYDILQFIQKLITLRKERTELTNGRTIDLSQWLNNGIVGYLRYDADDPKNYSITLVNTENEHKSFQLFVPYSYMFAELKMVDTINGYVTKTGMSDMHIELGPMESAIFIPDYLYKNNYNFYKRVAPIGKMQRFQ